MAQAPIVNSATYMSYFQMLCSNTCIGAVMAQAPIVNSATYLTQIEMLCSNTIAYNMSVLQI